MGAAVAMMRSKTNNSSAKRGVRDHIARHAFHAKMNTAITSSPSSASFCRSIHSVSRIAQAMALDVAKEQEQLDAKLDQ